MALPAHSTCDVYSSASVTRTPTRTQSATRTASATRSVTRSLASRSRSATVSVTPSPSRYWYLHPKSDDNVGLMAGAFASLLPLAILFSIVILYHCLGEAELGERCACCTCCVSRRSLKRQPRGTAKSVETAPTGGGVSRVDNPLHGDHAAAGARAALGLLPSHPRASPGSAWCGSALARGICSGRQKLGLCLNLSVLVFVVVIATCSGMGVGWYVSIVLLIFSYGFYLYDCYHDVTTKLLRNVITSTSAEQYLRQLQGNRITISNSVVCYHNHVEKSVSHYRDSSGNMRRVETTTITKVVTHRATSEWTYDECADVSEGIPYMEGLVLLSLSSAWRGSDSATTASYQQHVDAFKARHQSCDKLREYTNNAVVPGLLPQSLVFAVPHGGKPVLLSTPVYWAFSLLGLSYLYRVWLLGYCDEVAYTITKSVRRNH